MPALAQGEILRRLEDRRRTGDADFLWPDLPPEQRRAAMGQIRAVTAALVRRMPPPTRLSAADTQEARALGVAAFTAGMGPLLGWWIEEGRVEASPSARDILGLHLRHGRIRSRRLQAQTARIARGMHQVGVRPVLLKGMHTGAEFFPDPATRPSADIDLLVPKGEHPRAKKVLTDLEFEETYRLPHVPRSDWSPPGASGVISIEFDHADNPWHVDLHSGLDRLYFRGTRVDLGPEVLDTARCSVVGGERVRVLEQPYLTAYLAIHAGCDLATVRLVRLVELAWVIQADLASRRLDWDEFAALLDRSSTGRFVYPALALTEDLAPGTVDSGILDRLQRGATRRMHRVLRAVRAAELGPLRERSMDVKLGWAESGREVMAILSELLMPSGSVSVAAALAQRVSLARWRIVRGLTRRRPSAPTSPGRHREGA